MSDGELAGTSGTDRDVSRRNDLAAAGTGVAALAAGCASDGSSDGDGSGTTVGGGSAELTFVVVPHGEPSRLRDIHEPIFR